MLNNDGEQINYRAVNARAQARWIIAWLDCQYQFTREGKTISAQMLFVVYMAHTGSALVQAVQAAKLAKVEGLFPTMSAYYVEEWMDQYFGSPFPEFYANDWNELHGFSHGSFANASSQVKQWKKTLRTTILPDPKHGMFLSVIYAISILKTSN